MRIQRARPFSPLTLGLAVPAALALWAGTTAYASSAAQDVTTEITAQLEQMFKTTDLLTVQESSYEKGFLRSTHRMVIQPLGLEADPAAGWEVINHIQHGPLAGGTLAKAVVDTEIRFLDAEIQSAFEQAVGGQKPRIHTVMGLLGTSETSLNLPAGQFQSPQDGGQVSWEALSGRIGAGAQGRITGYDLAWPGLRLGSGPVEEGTFVMELGGMTLSGQQSFSSEKDLIGTGETSFKLGRLTMNDGTLGQMQMLDLQLVSGTTLADPEHYDAYVRYDIGTFEAPGKPALEGLKMHLSTRHLARQPLQNLLQVYADIRQQALAASETAIEFTPQQEKQMEEVFNQSLLGLLRSEPVLSLDQAGWSGVRLSGQTTLDGLAETIDAATVDGQPQLEAALSLVPDHLQAQLKMQLGPEAISTLGELGGTEMSAADLVSSGRFRQEGEQLVADFAYANGQMTLNGEELPGF